MADMITRCPNCSVAFRISDAHLKSAKGIVRCGSCLSIFNANEHLQFVQGSAQTTEKPAPEQPYAKHISSTDTTASETEDPDDELLFDDDFDDDELIFDSADDETYTDYQPASNLFESSENKSNAFSEDEDIDDTDESWALELLKDDSDLDIKFRKIVTPDDRQPSVAKDAADHPDPAAAASDNQVEATESGATPVKPADRVTPEALHGDADKTAFMVRREIKPARAVAATSTSSASVQPQQPKSDRPPARGVALHTTRVRRPASERVIEVDRLELLDHPNEDLHAIQKMIAAIEPESVDVGWRHNPVLWRKRLTWAGLALGALLFLVVQVAWLQFDRLNTVEPYRSFYSVACAVTGCTLSPMRDRSQIKTTNLYVRSHPDVQGALLIDVVMQNVAKFEQTFPSLILTFSNLRNEPIAERKFTPDEYLGGELSGSDAMPRLTPVHVELQIVDPGDDAVSYSIAIVD